MRRSQLRDAVNSQKFYFRKSVVPEDEEEAKDHPPQSHDHEYTEMSINNIINGKVSTSLHIQYCVVVLAFYGWNHCPFVDIFYFRTFTVHCTLAIYTHATYTHTHTQDEFPGLIPLVRMYVNSVEMDVDTRCTVLNYLRFISKKASGTQQVCNCFTNYSKLSSQRIQAYFYRIIMAYYFLKL